MKRWLLALMFVLPNALAQTYPDKPVRIMVGYPPGGGTDLVARLLQQPLSLRWGQPVVIDNRPGANAIIAAEAVARAKPDGYTLLMAYATEVALNPVTVKKLPYDPVNLQTGADILHIPYKGSGPATADAVSGQVQVTYASVASVLRFV